MRIFKIKLPLLAAIVAIIGTSFSVMATEDNNSSKEALYWYKYQENDPTTLVFDQFGTNPSVTCSPGPNICTKGFATDQGQSIPANQTGYAEVNLRD